MIKRKLLRLVKCTLLSNYTTNIYEKKYKYKTVVHKWYIPLKKKNSIRICSLQRRFSAVVFIEQVGRKHFSQTLYSLFSIILVIFFKAAIIVFNKSKSKTIKTSSFQVTKLWIAVINMSSIFFHKPSTWKMKQTESAQVYTRSQTNISTYQLILIPGFHLPNSLLLFILGSYVWICNN